MQKKERQAVVIIHGIGEQRPTVTLREFVESVAEHLKSEGKLSNSDVVFWDKPDPVSGNYETRKMTMRHIGAQPTTDFYEFYWAHHMRNTSYKHMGDWIKNVVFRMPHRVSPRLRPVFFFLWGLTLAALAVIAFMTFNSGLDTTKKWLTNIATGTAATLVIGIFTNAIYNYLGDAARYFDPSPENIDERMHIRKEGIELLRNLHNTGGYNRIIIVGHSLGGVIAYDLVKFLWSEYYKTLEPGKAADALSALGETELNNRSMLPQRAALQNNDSENWLSNYRNAQLQGFNYLNAIGNKWLISDLLTIGTPLAHAGHLFVYRNDLFQKLKNKREYPTCPPTIEPPDDDFVLSNDIQLNESGATNKLNYYTHSSPFAATRWTNIYYSSDFIGGPLKGLFGKGIKDIRREWKGEPGIFPGTHTRYWEMNNTHSVINDICQVLKRPKQE